MKFLRLKAKPKEMKYAIDPETAMAGKCTAWQVSRRGNPVYPAVNLGMARTPLSPPSPAIYSNNMYILGWLSNITLVTGEMPVKCRYVPVECRELAGGYSISL